VLGSECLPLKPRSHPDELIGKRKPGGTSAEAVQPKVVASKWSNSHAKTGKLPSHLKTQNCVCTLLPFILDGALARGAFVSITRIKPST
jgi:hypothetical protein